MANIAIFRINYKSDFILTLNSDAGWLTPFCIKFWTDTPSQAYFVGFDGTTYTHCAPVAGEPTKLLVQFDDHHLPIGDLKFQIGYHFTVADFPTSVEDEVINQASVIIEVDGAPAKVMLDLNGETAPEIEFSLPAYANEAQRIENEQQRIENEQQRIDNEQQRIDNEQTRQRNEGTRIENEQERVREFGQMKGDLEQATRDAAAAAENANEKAVYAKNQGDYAKQQGDYAKQQGDTAKADHERAEDDHRIAGEDHTQAGSDHTRAGEDHTRAGEDHTRAGEDHTRAGEDHTRAGEDHTRAESDHAAVEVYVDSLGAFDISSYHATGGVLAKYADLTAALGTNGANVPDTLRKGGMSVKYVQSSDNKYVQYRLMAQSFTTDTTKWQGVAVSSDFTSPNTTKSKNVASVDSIFGGLYNATNLNLASIVTNAYIYNSSQMVPPPSKVTLSRSSAVKNHVSFVNIENKFRIDILIPRASSSGASSITMAFADESLESGELSGTVQIDGEYISDAPASSGTNIVKTVYNSKNHKYLVLCYFYEEEANTPEAVGITSNEYADLEGKYKAVSENIKQLQEDVHKPVNDVASVSEITSARTASYGETGIYTSVSGSSANHIKFYPILKGYKYSCSVPRTQSGAANTQVFAFSNSILQSGELAIATVLDGHTIAGIPSSDGSAASMDITNSNGYKYLVVSYNSTGGEPTINVTSYAEYVELSKNIGSNSEEIAGIKKRLPILDNIENYPIVRIPCGEKIYDSRTSSCWTCHIDGKYSYVGHKNLFYRYERSDDGTITRKDTVSINYGAAYNNHIATGIDTDENYVYIVTRDPAGDVLPPTSGVGGYLMIFNKATLEKVSETILVDSADAVYKGMQGYLYKENYLIIPLQFKGWCVYNISNPQSPSLVRYYTPPTQRAEHQHCAIWNDGTNDYAAFSGFAGSIKIYNITDISNASYVMQYVVYDGINQCFDVAVSYPWLYATIGPTHSNLQSEGAKKGIMCFNIEDPTNFQNTMKFAPIPREYWGTEQGGDGQPTNMAFHNNSIIVDLDNVGLGLFSAIEDNVTFVKRLDFNDSFRPVTVSEDGLFLAASNGALIYNRFINSESINSMQSEINKLKVLVAKLMQE